MKNTVFTGAATAIITPLNKDGIDYELFGKIRQSRNLALDG